MTTNSEMLASDWLKEGGGHVGELRSFTLLSFLLQKLFIDRSLDRPRP